MVRYLYSKYNLKDIHIEKLLSGPRYITREGANAAGRVSYFLDPDTGIYTPTGEQRTVGLHKSEPIYVNDQFGGLGNKGLISYAGTGTSLVEFVYSTDIVKGRGSLVQSNIAAEDGSYPNDGMHTDGFWYVRGGLANSNPIVTLNTSDNRTLYENDTISIDGSANDIDAGNVIAVRYSLNGGTARAIATAISAGVAIPFSKVLQVKNSKFMDGNTVLLENLVEGQANTLRVWASDDQGGVSAEQIRTFYVTPNRPPSLVIDTFTQKVGLIDSDHITITGSVTDPEGGNIVVKYQIGEVNPVQVHDGPGGTFTFDIPLTNLKDGENSIILLATDSLNFTSQKTLKVNKAVSKTELLQSVRRYKALPPKGSAKNVIIWVQRDINLSLTAEASMVMKNEAENFVEMTKTNSAPVTNTIMEDEFTISSDVPKDDIVFQFNMTRSSIDSTESIHLISGGFE
ncbi:hypothetical protein MKY29_18290 [Psychrobacillus sp. FSL K6-2365]|uniref:hypothetical protein n=1 Tax=Psychrobacillus sp. FSL K6-2365 TaxID=2921546 RepID=UPI0030FC0784